jgi:hypothetical protein
MRKTQYRIANLDLCNQIISERELNNLGEQGWEFVTIIKYQKGKVYQACLFKKEKVKRFIEHLKK